MKNPTDAAISELQSYLARRRWAKPDADRDQPREAGKLGGRPPSTCACGACRNCKRRAKREAAAA